MAAISKNQFKITIIIILFTALSLYSAATEAQTFRSDKPVLYKGFEMSYGVRNFSIKSDISAINSLRVLTEGGSAGIMIGSRVVRTQLKGGFYYSASSVKRTVDIFELDASTNIYPLEAITKKKRTVPYVVSALLYNKLKFGGNCLEVDGTRRNRSVSDDNYIGKLHQVNFSTGIGVTHSLYETVDYFQFFAETRYNFPFAIETQSAAFNATTSTPQLMVTVGVRFGSRL